MLAVFTACVLGIGFSSYTASHKKTEISSAQTIPSKEDFVFEEEDVDSEDFLHAFILLDYTAFSISFRTLAGDFTFVLAVQKNLYSPKTPLFLKIGSIRI